jgi:hypothetical protein
MDRTAHAAAVGGHDPADRNSETGDPRNRATWASPSYVESVLFGRRLMRGSIPGSLAETRPTPEEKAHAANEQEPRMNKKGIEPCAS